MSTPYVVETSGLTKRFAERVAVDNVGLRVPAELRLGPNGAGKTALIRLLLGLTRATQGRCGSAGGLCRPSGRRRWRRSRRRRSGTPSPSPV
jgi:ABC-type multidrug transport system ATPase subunit